MSDMSECSNHSQEAVLWNGDFITILHMFLHFLTAPQGRGNASIWVFTSDMKSWK